MTADNKYFPVAICTFLTQIQNAIISKTKKHFFNFFYCSSEMCMKFRNILNIKFEYLSLIIFRNYILRKSSLLKRLKRSCFRTPFSKQRFKRFPKHCWNQQGHYYYLIFSMNLGNIELEKVFVSPDMLS